MSRKGISRQLFRAIHQYLMMREAFVKCVVSIPTKYSVVKLIYDYVYTYDGFFFFFFCYKFVIYIICLKSPLVVVCSVEIVHRHFPTFHCKNTRVLYRLLEFIVCVCVCVYTKHYWKYYINFQMFNNLE